MSESDQTADTVPKGWKLVGIQCSAHEKRVNSNTVYNSLELWVSAFVITFCDTALAKCSHWIWNGNTSAYLHSTSKYKHWKHFNRYSHVQVYFCPPKNRPKKVWKKNNPKLLQLSVVHLQIMKTIFSWHAMFNHLFISDELVFFTSGVFFSKKDNCILMCLGFLQKGNSSLLRTCLALKLNWLS